MSTQQPKSPPTLLGNNQPVDLNCYRDDEDEGTATRLLYRALAHANLLAATFTYFTEHAEELKPIDRNHLAIDIDRLASEIRYDLETLTMGLCDGWIVDPEDKVFSPDQKKALMDFVEGALFKAREAGVRQ